MSTMNTTQHIRHATRVDRDDPFVATRIDHHEVRTAVGRQIDYTKTRRVPMPLGERASLIMGGKRIPNRTGRY
jgi:hypothetical protein